MEPYDNSKIEKWAKVTNLGSIKNTIAALGIKHYKYSPNPKPLASAITVKLRTRQGLIDKISYGMPRSGVFVHKGVSRGHPAGNPRTEKKWFDIPTEVNMPELQKIIAEQDCTYVVNNLNIK